jgi:hypothetical protein
MECMGLKCSLEALVAHACNPSYSGNSDQEDHGSKLAPGSICVQRQKDEGSQGLGILRGK